MNAATFSRPPSVVPVTRLRLGRVVLLAVVTMAAVVGGAIWLLTTKARPLLTPTALLVIADPSCSPLAAAP